jgi:PilZ domain
MDRIPSKQHVVAGERFPKSRALPRYAITALAEVIEPVSKRRISGWTSVISDRGCHVRASDLLATGTIVQLRIEREGGTFETWARVANAVPQEGMGLAFFDTAESQRSLLKKWMDKAGIAPDSKESPEH